jgi:hypothetical protein
MSFQENTMKTLEDALAFFIFFILLAPHTFCLSSISVANLERNRVFLLIGVTGVYIPHPHAAACYGRRETWDFNLIGAQVKNKACEKRTCASVLHAYHGKNHVSLISHARPATLGKNINLGSYSDSVLHFFLIKEISCLLCVAQLTWIL